MSINISTNTVRSGLNTQTNDLRAILEQLPTAISRINTYIEDGALTGAAYTAHKTYLRDGHLPFLSSLQNGLIQYIEANGAHTRIIDAKLPHSNYNQGIIRETLQWLDRSIRELNDMINVQQQHHLIQLRNTRVRMRRDWQDRLNSLDDYLSLTNSIYNAAEAAMQIAATHLLCLEYARECPVTGAFILPTNKELFIRILEDEIAYLIANPEKAALLTDSRRQEIIDYIAEKYRGQDMLTPPPTLSNYERYLLIICFESLYSNKAEIINDFLKPISECTGHENDLENIKFLAYTSSSPFHDVFFAHLTDIGIKDHHAPDKQYCRGANIYIDINRVFRLDANGNRLVDGRMAYATFFHEIGHAIDNLMGKPSQVLDMAIVNDVRDSFNTYLTSLSPRPSDDDIFLIIDSLVVRRNEIDTGNSARDSTLNAIRADLQNHYSDHVLNRDADCTASDVYGGVTWNNVRGGWAHEDDYWKGVFLGIGAQRPSVEFFADTFSNSMTGHDPALQSINNNFPSAIVEFSSMMEAEAVRVGG